LTSSEEVLRKLTIEDPTFCRALVHAEVDDPLHTLDARAVALLRLASLMTSGAAGPTWHQCVWQARSAGLSPDEVVGSLMALAPTIGSDRLVSAAPALAQALDIDLEASLFAWREKEA
jgi:alkylhydroperoxidase/carboxymuconolactone decarboxylase family protein YurZ